MRIANVLLEVARRGARQPVTVAHLQMALGERATPPIMLILAALNMLPAPPGTSAILGPPIIFFSVQLFIASPSPWLPKWVLDRTIPFPLLQSYELRLSKRLKKAETVMRPRLTLLSGPAATKVVGLLCLLLAAVLALPIPFGNFIPGLAISLLALGLIGRDGLFVLGGVGVAVVALLVVAGPIYALAIWLA